MKNLYLIIVFLYLFLVPSFALNDSISIGGKKYQVKMMTNAHQIGPGTSYYSYRLPDYPLEVFIIEAQKDNPYVKFEACLSKDSILELETVQSMSDRKSYSGHQVLGGINGDFFTMTGAGAGTTCNGSMCQGQMGVIPTTFGPLLGFDINNVPFIDDMRFFGQVSYNGENIEIDNVNAARNTDKLILYTYLNGKSTKTNDYGTEVILTLKEGNRLTANSAITCVVKSVNEQKGNTILTQNDFVLSGHGAKAAFLNKLNVGDDVVLHLNITLLNYPDLKPELTDMIGSNCIFLKDGKPYPITTDSGAPTGDNPRTFAGFSADKSKVIFGVVDGRSTLSKGLTTSQLADIALFAGASTAMNFDGGGSSVLIVRGQPGNKPAQMPLRSVANAFLIVSTAPEDNLPAAIDIDCPEIKISYGNKEQLNVSSLNQYGSVINYKNLTGVTFKVHGDIGTITTNGLFSASGKDTEGYIEASYNGLSDRISVVIQPIKEIRFSLPVLTMDHMHEFTLEVRGVNDEGKSYIVDNDLLCFKSLDESVATIDANGVVHGLKDGTVDIEVTTPDGLLKSSCQIRVEAAKGEKILDDFKQEWQVSMTDFISMYVLRRAIPEGFDEEMLEVNYTFTYLGRTAFIEIEKPIAIYGIPEAIELNMISNGKLSSLMLSLGDNKGNAIFEKFRDSTLKSYRYDIDFEKLNQTDFPLSFAKIRLSIELDKTEYTRNEVYTGSFFLKDIKVIYPDKTPETDVAGWEDNNKLFLFPNPVIHTLYLEYGSLDVKSLVIYSLTGEVVFSCSEKRNMIDLSFLADGFYICEVITSNNKRIVNKILLRK